MTDYRRCGAVTATFVLLTCVAVATVSQAKEQTAGTTRLQTGQKAPRFGPMKLHNAELAEMETFTLAHYVGDSAKTPAKAVLVSFFATWCEPCKKEMPFLAELDRTFREKGLQVVVISIDKEEEAFEQVRALTKEHDVRFPVLMDRFNLLARRYLGEKTAMPSLFLLSADGSIATVKQGYDEDASAFLTAEVKKLLGE